MTCNCSTRSFAEKSDVLDALNQAYEFLGMPNLAHRFKDVCSAASEATRALEKAERAKNLGLLANSNDRSLLAAKRQRDASVRLLISLRASIDDHMTKAEWKKALKIINTPDPRQGNPNQLLDELSEGANDQLLNSNLSPASCLEARNSLNRAIGIARQGIEPAIKHIVQSIAAFEDQLVNGDFESRIKTLSSSEANPIIATSSADYFVCTAAAVAVLIAATVACGYIPACWCCLFPIFLAGFLAWINECETIPRN